MQSQPKALYVLFFTEMWECFSYYGMRMLLVLYMYEQLSFSESDSIAIYALYTSLVELGSIAGGYAADRYLGAKNSIFYGGTLIATGHLILSCFDDHQSTLLTSLAFIIVGSAFFKTNIKALLGEFYEDNDKRRGPGFALFYVGINIGALMATALCGNIAIHYGWSSGFGLAALGMLAGLTILCLKNHVLENKGASPKRVRKRKQILLMLIALTTIPLITILFNKRDMVTPLLPIIAIVAIGFIALKARNCTHLEKKNMLSLLSLVGVLIIFFAFEELMGSMMMLFLERYVEKTIFGISIHSSSLTMSNPLTIIILGPFITRAIDTKIAKNIRIAFSFLAAGFLTLYISIILTKDDSLIPIIYPLLCFGLIAIGELFIAPTIVAYCTEIAPKKLRGLLMGGVMMGHAYASLVSGFIAQNVVVPIKDISAVSQYQYFFLSVVLLSTAIAIGCVLLENFHKYTSNLRPNY
ncbi:MAG: peptide MFS transporter [Chlamydiota bacterium]|nr:peptide MFS transporter [Chlamydiota bacterium]